MTISGLKSRSAVSFMLLAALGCESRSEVPAGDDLIAPQQVALEQAYAEFVTDFLQLSCDSIAPFSNEVHDCQRLVRPAAQPPRPLEFGPLIGILPDTTVLASGASAYRTPQVAARISNAGSLVGSDAYPALGLDGPAEGDETSTFCLWMYLDDEDGWQADIHPTTSPGETDCGEAPDPDGDTWSSLTVELQTYGDEADITDYPNTARWQWTGGSDPDPAEVHFIGIKCADGWCAVLPAGRDAPDMPQPDSLPPTRAIAGWFDAQFLGVMVNVPGEPPDSMILAPGPWGAIYPEPVPPTDHPDWKWGIRVASFELEPGPGGGFGRYTAKVNAGGNGRSWAVLSWQGDPAVPPDVVYHNSQGGDTAEAEGVITADFPHGPAMSARWRWKETDETAWMPCPYYGCCDVREGNFF